MTLKLTRRSLVLGATVAVTARRTPELSDGQTIWLGDAEHVATDIVAPARDAPGHELSVAALRAIMALPFTEDTGAAGAPDRWGRKTGPISLVTRGGAVSSVQAELVRRGAARVSPQSDDFAFIDALFALEDGARELKRGLWALPAYRVNPAKDTTRKTGFQIYDGVIREAQTRDGRVYFNFGADYRTDFTVTVRATAQKKWRSGLAPTDYAGKRVQIRGEALWINGPSIELRHELQMRTKSPAEAGP
ncbi:MAG: thermonuclease family protein [Parvularculaceae bacterium]|nr:thermonuclease family protein [Parvularculaceae bacterium]